MLNDCPKCRKPREVSKAAFDRWFRQNPADGPFTSLAAFLADYCMCDGQLPDPPADPPLPAELAAPFTSDPDDLADAAETLRELGYDGLAAAAARAASRYRRLRSGLPPEAIAGLTGNVPGQPGAELVRFLYTGPAPVDPDAPFHAFLIGAPEGPEPPEPPPAARGNWLAERDRRREREPWLYTMPGTQFEYSTARPWCAGHRWRSRRGLGWLHRLGHRARVLRLKSPPAPPSGYVGPCS